MSFHAHLPPPKEDEPINPKIECRLNTDCDYSLACVRELCINPCDDDICAPNALCTICKHIPVCTCPSGMEGNPYGIHLCKPIGQPAHDEYHGCRPSPCGSFSQCREINSQAVCTCLPGYIGSPPTCRPECTVNSDCPSNEACVNDKCKNPCDGTCGVNAG